MPPFLSEARLPHDAIPAPVIAFRTAHAAVLPIPFSRASAAFSCLFRIDTSGDRNQMGDKLSTEEILAAIRGGSSPAPDSAASETENQDTAPAEDENPAADEKADASASESSADDQADAPKPAAKPAPTGTAGILDAIRSGGAGSGASAAGGAKQDKPSSAPASGSASAAPKSTADILAAVRGGAGGAKSAASKPAKKKSAETPAVDSEAVRGLSAAEIIRAARQGQPPEVAEKKPVPLPSRPLKPKLVVRSADEMDLPTSRRGFVSRFFAWITTPVVLAWTAFTATATIASLATARFMMPNVLVEPPTKFKIGPPSDYPPGTVSTKWKAQFGVWIVNNEIDGQQIIYALSTVCTHLGCTPNWLEGEQKFKCPCHGSGFYKSGINFEGPAPRPLERMGIRLAPDGMLEVDKSVKFQQELGQWENPASYVPVV